MCDSTLAHFSITCTGTNSTFFILKFFENAQGAPILVSNGFSLKAWTETGPNRAFSAQVRVFDLAHFFEATNLAWPPRARFYWALLLLL